MRLRVVLNVVESELSCTRLRPASSIVMNIVDASLMKCSTDNWHVSRFIGACHTHRHKRGQYHVIVMYLLYIHSLFLLLCSRRIQSTYIKQRVCSSDHNPAKMYLIKPTLEKGELCLLHFDIQENWLINLCWKVTLIRFEDAHHAHWKASSI